jgi:hypothetical protein
MCGFLSIGNAVRQTRGGNVERLIGFESNAASGPGYDGCFRRCTRLRLYLLFVREVEAEQNTILLPGSQDHIILYPKPSPVPRDAPMPMLKQGGVVLSGWIHRDVAAGLVQPPNCDGGTGALALSSGTRVTDLQHIV